MIEVKREGIVLEKTSLSFENEGVLNPAVIKVGNQVHMFYRAVRRGNYSTIGYCKFEGPTTLIDRHRKPFLFPQFGYETHGIEDPRLVKIDDTFFMTFTAYDGVNALGALATSLDLLDFERYGLIVPQFTYEEFSRLAEVNGRLNEKYERYHRLTIHSKTHDIKVWLWDKNLIFFPRKINNQFYFLHRIRPDIQIAAVSELEDLNSAYWEDYFLHFKKHILMTPHFDHEISYIGGGCPPIETPDGWVLIYHGVHDSTSGYVYSACAALLDLDNPTKVIARLPYPLLKPELAWELKGEVSNVVFPTGTAQFDDTLYIYYGAADKRIACASLNLNELTSELLNYKI